MKPTWTSIYVDQKVLETTGTVGDAAANVFSTMKDSSNFSMPTDILLFFCHVRCILMQESITENLFFATSWSSASLVDLAERTLLAHLSICLTNALGYPLAHVV